MKAWRAWIHPESGTCSSFGVSCAFSWPFTDFCRFIATGAWWESLSEGWVLMRKEGFSRLDLAGRGVGCMNKNSLLSAPGLIPEACFALTLNLEMPPGLL